MRSTADSTPFATGIAHRGVKSGTSPDSAIRIGCAPAGLEAFDDLLDGDQPLVAAILRDSPHQIRPVRVARVVVPDQDVPAGPHDPGHLAEGRAHGCGVCDVVQRRDGEGEIE